jgi:cell division protein FtsL
MGKKMNEEIQQATEESVVDITTKMLAVCEGRLIGHCVTAALSVAGSMIQQDPSQTASLVSNLRKLADHIENKPAIH